MKQVTVVPYTNTNKARQITTYSQSDVYNKIQITYFKSHKKIIIKILKNLSTNRKAENTKNRL